MVADKVSCDVDFSAVVEGDAGLEAALTGEIDDAEAEWIGFAGGGIGD